jgi:hypothetical protein
MKFKTTLSASKMLLALPMINDFENEPNEKRPFAYVESKELSYSYNYIVTKRANIPETVPNCIPFDSLSPSWIAHLTCHHTIESELAQQ